MSGSVRNTSALFQFPRSGWSCASHDLLSPGQALNAFQRSIADTVAWWYTGDGPLVVTTSGSTGVPRTVTFTRDQVEESINRTAQALQLDGSASALLCIDPRYIGGKMMILRALSLGMDLVCVEPASDPLATNDLPKTSFAALVPLQLENILKHPLSLVCFREISKVIIGGAAISPALERSLKGSTNCIYQTYGMTETLSHIALRDLSAGETDYHLLSGITISTDNRNCLVASVPGFPNPIVTNDLVEVTEKGRFRWLGRWDNVINSGGIKVVPEELEQKISLIIAQHGAVSGYFIAGRPDDRLGEHVTLILECTLTADLDREKLMSDLRNMLGKFEVPREFRMINSLVKTSGGKLDRRASLTNSIPLTIGV